MSTDLIAAEMKRTTLGVKSSRQRTGHINQTGMGRAEGEDGGSQFPSQGKVAENPPRKTPRDASMGMSLRSARSPATAPIR